ncbi:MAG TPA: hypothetical protein PLK31_08700, partial [Chloroflexota bacterium]|nr:hypothetical protein [Chloroflexota bacterium]
LLLTDESGQISAWLLLNDDFAAEAQQLRQAYPWQIEERRHSTVQIAIPTGSPLPAGRLYAVLPTADAIPLAFYLNADFFPTTDRKRVHFASGYQAAWNQAAVTAAATLLANNLALLCDHLMPTALWHLLASTAESATQAQQGQLQAPFAHFWQMLRPRLPQTPVFYTAAGAWLQPPDGVLLPTATAVSPAVTIPLLHNLQLPILHPDLADYAPLLHRLGTPFITAQTIADALRRAGLSRATPLPEAPPFLRHIEAWRPLWTLLDVLLRGLPPVERERALSAMNHCAVALTDHLILRPLPQLYRGQPEAQALFPHAHWLHPELDTDRFPGRYVPVFGVRQAVDLLADMPIDLLEEAWRWGRLDIPRLFRWFETQQIEIFADDPTLA